MVASLGVSCCRVQALEHTGSGVMYGAGAHLPHGMWDPPEPGTKFMLPA